MALIEIGDKYLSSLDVKDLLSTDHPMVEEFRFEKTGETPSIRDFAVIICTGCPMQRKKIGTIEQEKPGQAATCACSCNQDKTFKVTTHHASREHSIYKRLAEQANPYASRTADRMSAASGAPDSL